MKILECIGCEHHRVIGEDSYCDKERAFSRYTKCISAKALFEFLEKNKVMLEFHEGRV